MNFMMILALHSGFTFFAVILTKDFSNKLKLLAWHTFGILMLSLILPVQVEENDVNLARESIDEVIVSSVDMIDSSIENKDPIKDINAFVVQEALIANAEKTNITFFDLTEKFKEVSSENYTEEDLDNYRTETFTNENQKMLWVMSDKGISGIGLSDDEEVSSEEDVIELFKKAGSKINVVQGYVIGNDMSKSQAVFLMITKGFLMHLSKLCGLIISAYIGFSIISSINTSIANYLNSIEEKKLKKEKRIEDLEEQLKEVKLLRKELKAMKRYNKKKEKSIEIEME
ncbi:hypothetical protein [Vibrio splendidus]|uniref:hypothetical protein n=1 Tax=Vibrio splendidus TaxID=29497 RepID=UPI003D13A9D5